MPFVLQLVAPQPLPGRVVNLVGMLPRARYDGVSWTSVRVQEAAAPDGPWTQIASLVLSNPDADPTAPAPRNITTANAQLSTGWYRLVFVDARGGVSEPSEVVRSSIDSDMPPDPDDVRANSPLLRQMFPEPSVDPLAMGQLRRWTYQAIGNVMAITWRIIDPTLGDPAPEDYQGEALPMWLEDVAVQAIVRMVERYAVIGQPSLAQQFATGRQLSGFNAGGYSESYFAPGEFIRRGVVTRPAMDNDATINDALWAIATEDAKDYFVWRNTGTAPPLGLPTSFDYRRETIGYGAGQSGVPGGYAHGGPDGF